MPAERQNGTPNCGFLETTNGSSFLFTSESVGEGHPGTQ